MRHRISAGVLVDEGDRVLLVRHVKPGAYDFWVAPGGGVEGIEDLRDAARREAHEECGLEIEPLQIAYIEDLWDAEMRVCKIWFTARAIGGTLCASGPDASAEHIVDARFMDRSELQGKTVFPPVLHEQYWIDRAQGFTQPRYLGIRRMEIQ